MQPIIEKIGQHYGMTAAWIFTFITIFLRYAFFAGLAYYIFYIWKKRAWFNLKIQPKFPKINQLRQEIIHSLMTAAIFALMAFCVYFLRKAGYGKLYFDWKTYSLAYYIFTLVFVVVLHDTYFYWMHRLMHHPKLFKIFHLIHHKSNNPTPWTALSFHPLEAIVEFGIIPILALVMPLHYTALIFFTVWSMVFNILGHTGYEFSPSGFTKHPIFKWLNTPTHHNLHHQKSHYNYSLYFNFWDRVMGTNDPDYDSSFERIKERSKTPNEIIIPMV